MKPLSHPLVFAIPGKIAPVRKPGIWPLGLLGLLQGAGCVQPELLPGLTGDGVAAAKSGVLFRGRPEGGVELIPGDRDRWAEPITVADEEPTELWLYLCSLEALRIGPGRLPRLEPDPRPYPCLYEGAPCPLAAYAWSDQGWAPTNARRQPWPGPQGDPGRCARPGPVAYDTLTTPGTNGSVHFLSALAEGAVLVSASDNLGPDRARRGVLRAYALPIGEPMDTWTGTTTFISGVRRGDGAVELVGSDGSTALAELKAGALRVSATGRLPEVATSSCVNELGREMFPTRGGAMGYGEGEAWLLNNCGVLLKRTDNSPWSLAYQPTEMTRLAGPDVALLWVGPGEVYASNVERAGVLHYRGGVAQHEPSEVGVWLTTSLARGDDGRLYAGNFFGELLREDDGRWRRYGISYAGAINSLAPIGDGFFVGYGVPGIPQIQRGQSCSDELRPAIPSGFARTLLRVGDQVVALLVGEPGWIASFGFDYEPCSPDVEGTTP